MERCTASTCFLTLYQQTGKTPYLLQSPLLEAGLSLYNTRFTKVDGVPYLRHFLPLTHISPFRRGYVSNDTDTFTPVIVTDISFCKSRLQKSHGIIEAI